MTDPYRVLFVCTGNICRSPMGEIILRAMLEEAGLDDRVEVDSRGLGPWHEGQGADRRTLAALDRGGYDGRSHVAHQLLPNELAERDLVLAADRGHLHELQADARQQGADPDIKLIREFDPAAVDAGELEVDDPYYGDAEDFDRCRDEVEAACRGLVDRLPTMLG